MTSKSALEGGWEVLKRLDELRQEEISAKKRLEYIEFRMSKVLQEAHQLIQLNTPNVKG